MRVYVVDGAEIFITETLHTDVLCHGDNTGVLSVLASGGSGNILLLY